LVSAVFNARSAANFVPNESSVSDATSKFRIAERAANWLTGLPVEMTDVTRGSGARKAASTIGQTLIQFAARSR
jgi:hypothetical protein